MRPATSPSILLMAFPFIVKKMELSRTQVHIPPAFLIFHGPLCLNEPVLGCCSQLHAYLYNECGLILLEDSRSVGIVPLK